MIEKFKTNAEVIENGDKYLYGNHVRMPISMERGEGVYVFDKDGNKYLDFVGGRSSPSSTAPTTSTMSPPSRPRSSSSRTAALIRSSLPTPAPRPTKARSSSPASTPRITAIPSASSSSR